MALELSDQARMAAELATRDSWLREMEGVPVEQVRELAARQAAASKLRVEAADEGWAGEGVLAYWGQLIDLGTKLQGMLISGGSMTSAYAHTLARAHDEQIRVVEAPPPNPHALHEDGADLVFSAERGRVHESWLALPLVATSGPMHPRDVKSLQSAVAKFSAELDRVRRIVVVAYEVEGDDLMFTFFEASGSEVTAILASCTAAGEGPDQDPLLSGEGAEIVGRRGFVQLNVNQGKLKALGRVLLPAEICSEYGTADSLDEAEKEHNLPRYRSLA